MNIIYLLDSHLSLPSQSNKCILRVNLYSRLLFGKSVTNVKRTTECTKPFAVGTGLTIHATLLVDILLTDFAFGGTIWWVSAKTGKPQVSLLTSASKVKHQQPIRISAWEADAWEQQASLITCLASLYQEACFRSISALRLLLYSLHRPAGLLVFFIAMEDSKDSKASMQDVARSAWSEKQRHQLSCESLCRNFNEAEASCKYKAALTFHLSGQMTFASFFSAQWRMQGSAEAL